jgi:hypothetical protein
MPTVAFRLFPVFEARARTQFLISGFIKDSLLAFFNSDSENQYWVTLYKWSTEFSFGVDEEPEYSLFYLFIIGGMGLSP